MTGLLAGRSARVGLRPVVLCGSTSCSLTNPPTISDLDGLARLEDVVACMRERRRARQPRPGAFARSVTRVVELDLAQHTNTRSTAVVTRHTLEEREVVPSPNARSTRSTPSAKADLVARPVPNA